MPASFVALNLYCESSDLPNGVPEIIPFENCKPLGSVSNDSQDVTGPPLLLMVTLKLDWPTTKVCDVVSSTSEGGATITSILILRFAKPPEFSAVITHDVEESAIAVPDNCPFVSLNSIPIGSRQSIDQELISPPLEVGAIKPISMP